MVRLFKSLSEASEQMKLVCSLSSVLTTRHAGKPFFSLWETLQSYHQMQEGIDIVGKIMKLKFYFQHVTLQIIFLNRSEHKALSSGEDIPYKSVNEWTQCTGAEKASMSLCERWRAGEQTNSTDIELDIAGRAPRMTTGEKRPKIKKTLRMRSLSSTP